MKIKKIEVKNFKAVSEQEISFNGCSAIITAGNNKGKTSLLRGLIDRLRGEKPNLILRFQDFSDENEKLGGITVKDGEVYNSESKKKFAEKGYSIMELTDGSRIEWSFTEKSEKFAYITKDGIKQTTGVISLIGERYFGKKFDIDKFLNSSPKAQIKELQKFVGLDFTEIDEKYKIAYDERTEVNREVNRLRELKIQKPEPVEKSEIEQLKKQLAEIKEKNNNLRENWKVENEKHLQENEKFNKKQLKRATIISSFENELKNNGINLLKDFFDFEGAKKYIENLEKPVYENGEMLMKKLTNLPEPDYTPTFEIEQKIENANEQLRKFDAYERDLQVYESWVKEGKQAKEAAQKADEKVKKIEAEKREMINSAKIPKEFEITDNEILYKGLPLTNSQQSSSAKYIAALKLGALVLGEVRTLHFDASFLDKNSLSEVQKWAEKNDLQLLIERPDFDGGEIKFDIIEKI